MRTERSQRATASKGSLLAACSYWARLDVTLPPEEPAGDAAHVGSAVHDLVDYAIQHAMTCGKLDLAKVHDGTLAEGCGFHGVTSPADRARVHALWQSAAQYLCEHWRLGWQSEVALAWDWDADAGRTLASQYARDYSQATATEIPGTADVVTWDGDTLVIVDWKTGRSELAGYDGQMDLLALAGARAWGASRVRVVLVRFADDGSEPEERIRELGELELDGLAHAYGAALRAAAERTAEPRPGEHCSALYCPARGSCPASMAVVRSMPEAAPLADLVATAIATPEQAGDAYRRLRVVKDAVKLVEDRIRAVVEEHGAAPTSDGKALRLVTTTRETFSAARVPPERRDEVLADLRALGALQSSTSNSLREGKR